MWRIHSIRQTGVLYVVRLAKDKGARDTALLEVSRY